MFSWLVTINGFYAAVLPDVMKLSSTSGEENLYDFYNDYIFPLLGNATFLISPLVGIVSFLVFTLI